ncbi:hypothetical protein [Pseudomonas sp. CFBP 13719]|uniref:hypothetical protein n=1 Tax=Pseudomonas sp. CFBP 13719 TaxID=2775303 RepID=UPI0017859404|nr:hypothetical protein [Pseudomonas sp. CFBP 13719]MBD8614789.1 hypothetical protein [Pseudomonas putida]MBD8681527.1 hypothetical protein [Pseudomonas sp. CFBP 13719]
MSDIQARHRFRQDYISLINLLEQMACDGKRFDRGDFETIHPMLCDLCATAEALPELARSIAGEEGKSLVRWYVGQWPKRDLDIDGSASQNALAEDYATLAIRVVDSLRVDLGWETKNLIGIDPVFDRYLVDRILNQEMGLFSYDLRRQDRYDSDYYTDAQNKGSALEEVISNLASSGRQQLLNDLVSGVNELLKVAPESIDSQSRAQLFMSCFHQPIEKVGPELKASLAALLSQSQAADVKHLFEYQTDTFYEVMLNAAGSGMREEVEPLIQLALDHNCCPRQYKQLLTGLEQHTHLDVAKVAVSFAHKILAKDPESDGYRYALMSYYLVNNTPVVADQIEFVADDMHVFAGMIRNQYSSWYSAERQTLNMKNFKALLCEYLGQHPGQLQKLERIPEISHIVKTLPYWHDHSFAADLGL